MKTVKNILKEQIVGNDDGEKFIDIYEIDLDIAPTISREPEDGIEGIELENWSIVSVDDAKMVMCCGGDWEDPYRLNIDLINNRLVVTSFTREFEEGMSEEELLELLK